MFAEERKKIAQLEGTPSAQAMSSMADALRTMLRAAAGARPAELDGFLSECDAIAYAPSAPSRSSDGVVPPEAIERALALARLIEESA